MTLMTLDTNDTLHFFALFRGVWFLNSRYYHSKMKINLYLFCILLF